MPRVLRVIATNPDTKVIVGVKELIQKEQDKKKGQQPEGAFRRVMATVARTTTRVFPTIGNKRPALKSSANT